MYQVPPCRMVQFLCSFGVSRDGPLCFFPTGHGRCFKRYCLEGFQKTLAVGGSRYRKAPVDFWAIFVVILLRQFGLESNLGGVFQKRLAQSHVPPLL